MRCNPRRWLLWLPLAALPLLAALSLNSGKIERKLTETAGANLASAKADWAKLSFDGRDARLEGEAPGLRAIEAAVKAVADTHGVRRVDASPAKVVLAPPTLAPLLTNNNRPEIKGTWPEAFAKTLKVILPGRSYVLGTDAELKSDGAGNWALVPAEPLKDGSYDVSVEVDDGAGNSSKIAAPAKIVIDTLPPAMPVFSPFKSSVSPQSLSGSWPEGDATSLKVGLAGKTHTLGSDADLTSASGTWTLALPQPLPDGVYDLSVEAIDAAGNSARLILPEAVTIATEIPAPTVARYSGNSRTPLVSGTWAEMQGNKLTVAIGGKSYELGRDVELSSDGLGNWRLKPSAPLKDGVYDVVVTVTDAKGNATKDETVGEIEIDATGPAAPTVNKATGFPITGNFAPGDTKILRVTVGGRSYTLGSDPALTAKAETWTLAPDQKLAPGTYDVIVEAVDSFGNVSADAGKEALVIEADPADPTPPPPTKAVAPTVTPIVSLAARPTISGTFAEGATTALKVTIAGASYVLGTNEELTASAGQWSLKLPDPLKDGTYDVTVEATDADGKIVTDDTQDEIVIDAMGPAAPTVNLYSMLDSPKSLSGTWPEGDAVSLVVTFNGRSWTLGKDAGLTSNNGHWMLEVAETLKPGSYDVAVVATDKHGRSSSDQTRFEILVKDPPPPPPPPPPPEAVAPTVAPLVSLAARPTITGTWDEAAARSLKVAVAGNSYALGANEELTTSAGQWTLKLPTPLKDGTYDVVVETTDANGKVLTDSTKDELVVDAAGPASPTVNLYSMLESPKSLSGTWPEGDAVNLAVTFNGKSWTLGKDPGLTSEKGNWSLEVPDVLKPGSYDVAVVATDKHGRSSSDQTRFEILVKEPPPPPPPPVNCVDDFARTLQARPLYFDTDKSAVTPAAAAIIKDLAAIATTCPEDRLEVGGYTDDVGSAGYNQALSERRAVAVAHALADLGIARERLSAVGYGEMNPVADNNTDEGRALNRRIEIKIVK